MKALVLGAGGFIGHHLVNRLKNEGFYVVGADLKYPSYENTKCDQFEVGDLRDVSFVERLLNVQFDEIYQLAADMGGAGYIFTGINDSQIMHNSATINLNLLESLAKTSFQGKVFYSSSACIYPEHNQLDPNNPLCTEGSAYPANPDSEYGWEKLFSERLYLAYKKNNSLNVSIARYHNIYGPMGAWANGKEKAPAALCRKIASATNGSSIEIWGDGNQTRSFLFVDECVEGTIKLLRSEYSEPVNIGSDYMISINNFVDLIADVAGKTINKVHIDGPLGVRGRNSDNTLISNSINWRPDCNLRSGIEITYRWIEDQVKSGSDDIK